jgi:hypothetical protein
MSDDPHAEHQAVHQAFEHHHSTAVMMLARSKIERRPNDPYYGYRDLARYVHAGLTDPMDKQDMYLRLLACAKAERLALPSLGHMQALMSMVWDAHAIPAHLEADFHEVCHRVNETLCYEIGKFATDSMKALAATLRVDLQVKMAYDETQEPTQGVAPAPQPEADTKAAPSANDGSKPTLH